MVAADVLRIIGQTCAKRERSIACAEVRARITVDLVLHSLHHMGSDSIKRVLHQVFDESFAYHHATAHDVPQSDPNHRDHVHLATHQEMRFPA